MSFSFHSDSVAPSCLSSVVWPALCLWVGESEPVVLCLLQIATSLQQIQDFLHGTLLFVQQQQLCMEKGLWDVVQQCVYMLKEKDLITVSDVDLLSPALQITKLGRAAYKGKLPTGPPLVVSQYKDVIKSWTHTVSQKWAICGLGAIDGPRTISTWPLVIFNWNNNNF